MERRRKNAPWQGPESHARTVIAREQPAAVRAACSAAVGHAVDCDTKPSDRHEDSEGSPLTGFLAGPGCLVAVLAVLAIWVNGLVD